MKSPLFFGIFVFGALSHAGVFDGSPLDPRNPVEVCQKYVDSNFSSNPEFLSACGKITTRFAYKCIENVSEKVGGLSVLTINSCSFVNNKESLLALQSLIKNFPINNELIVAASFSNTPAESTCVVGIANRLSEMSLRTVMKCNSESLIDYGLRWTKAITL
ncbi:MAG: hypothetical protein ACK5V3_17095 [Bdellovibrionales bacterium]